MNIPPCWKAIHYNKSNNEIVIKCDRLYAKERQSKRPEYSRQQSNTFGGSSVDKTEKLISVHNNRITQNINFYESTLSNCTIAGMPPESEGSRFEFSDLVK